MTRNETDANAALAERANWNYERAIAARFPRVALADPAITFDTASGTILGDDVYEHALHSERFTVRFA